MKNKIVVLFSLLVLTGISVVKAQQFVDKKFVGCGLDYEVKTSRLSLRADDTSPLFPMDSMPISFNIQILQGSREIEKVYLFASISGSNTTFTPILTDADSSSHSLSYFEKETSTDNCWGFAEKNLLTYDVTNYFTKNGNYYLAGFPLDTLSSGTDTDGLMLIIIYTDPYASFIGHLNFSKGIIESNLSTVSYVIQDLNVKETSSDAIGFVLISDLQDQGSRISINNSSLFVIANESFWDYETKTTAVLKGQTTSSFKLESPNDCAHLLLTGIYYRESYITSSALLDKQGDTLVASSGSIFEWLLEDSTLVVGMDTSYIVAYPGNYTVIIEDTAGCKSNSNAVKVVCFENFIPMITKIGRKLMIGDFYASYQWYKNDSLIFNEVSDSLYANDSARYFVQVIDSLGCEYKSNEVVFSAPTSVQQLKIDELLLYPNPSAGMIQVILPKYNQYSKIIITDLRGAVIYQNKIGNLNRMEIELISGVYLVSVVCEDGNILNKKIIIQ